MDTDPQFFKQLSQKARPSKTPKFPCQKKDEKRQKERRGLEYQKEKKRIEVVKMEIDEEKNEGSRSEREKRGHDKKKKKKEGFWSPPNLSRTHTSVILVSPALEHKTNRM